ncbi:MAG: glucose 1-dehydrogenase [Dehalococcoidia bacterium]
MFSLEGKAAIVTGASRWTGKTIAIEMARAGADVAVSARTADAVQKTAEEIRALGKRSIAIPADMTVAEEVDEMVRRTNEEFGRIDILVNNVGDALLLKSVSDLSQEEWNRVINQNLTPPFLCSKAVLDIMMKQGGGSIVNVASGEGLRAHVTNLGYGAAKAAVINMTMGLAGELAQYNIRVNAVAPGFIDTTALTMGLDYLPDLKALFDRVPMKRAALQEEIAGPVIFLSSDAAGYVTGITVVVDGGMTSTL